MSDEVTPPAANEASAEYDRHMLEALVCPQTRGPLTWDAGKKELVSRSAGLAYPIRGGIPIMLVDEARKLDG
jgi:uncharacterized protein YbaR (Trm112 family)